jgi:hypothetical protein
MELSTWSFLDGSDWDWLPVLIVFDSSSGKLFPPLPFWSEAALVARKVSIVFSMCLEIAGMVRSFNACRDTKSFEI